MEAAEQMLIRHAQDRSFRGILLVVLLASLFGRDATAMAGAFSGNEICDAKADYFLGVEDYPETAKLHRLLVAAHPNGALAHYHLGFAYGMLGRHGEELAEYRQAASLGLKQWDLFLNLGLVYLEDGNSDAAIDALRTAVALGPDHPEGHFNLALAYEQYGRLAEARQEMFISLRLDTNQAEARNMLGVIYAEDGNYVLARQVWSDIAGIGFEPARTNLAILDRADGSAGVGLSRGASIARSTLPVKHH
jgi:tetratricopeptide (TPR) repeat protein